jgi:peptide deformylase
MERVNLCAIMTLTALCFVLLLCGVVGGSAEASSAVGTGQTCQGTAPASQWKQHFCQSFEDLEVINLSDVVRTIGDEVLNISCADVLVSDITSSEPQLCEGIRLLHQSLREFRRINGFGRAIAAPQVGLPYRAVAIHLNGEERTMFNPCITFRSEEKFSMWDDCLSFPDLMVSVERHKSVSVSFVNETGHVEVWSSLPQSVSELLQHEIDHLDGVHATTLATPLLDKQGHPLCASIVNRRDWLARRAWYESLVDYAIAITVPAENAVL